MKNEKWTTNDFKQEKRAIENLKEKIVKCSEVVVRYLTAGHIFFTEKFWEAVAWRCSVNKMFL